MPTPKIIPASELIINSDGSVFHLHLKPEQLTDRIILVGDPSRVDMVAEFFDTKTSSSPSWTLSPMLTSRPVK